jgi:hypothetical protein
VALLPATARTRARSRSRMVQHDFRDDCCRQSHGTHLLAALGLVVEALPDTGEVGCLSVGPPSEEVWPVVVVEHWQGLEVLPEVGHLQACQWDTWLQCPSRYLAAWLHLPARQVHAYSTCGAIVLCRCA